MAKMVQRQERNTIAMVYLKQNQSKGSSLQRISITNKFVCLLLQIRIGFVRQRSDPTLEQKFV